MGIIVNLTKLLYHDSYARVLVNSTAKVGWFLLISVTMA